MQKAMEVIVASWVVSGSSRDDFPFRRGLLDAALKIAIDKGAFAGVLDDLKFVQGPVGVHCTQIQDIIETGFMSLFLSAPNPVYEAAAITISREAAIALLDEYGIKETDAAAWGKQLREALAIAKKQAKP